MSKGDKREEYLKNYKKYHYSKTRKIVTFPLLFVEFEKLKTKASILGMSSNKLAREIVLNHLENNESKTEELHSKEQLELIREYMRVSRGIATNINQMAYKANIGEFVDVNILIHSLKKNEDEFKALVKKVL